MPSGAPGQVPTELFLLESAERLTSVRPPHRQSKIWRRCCIAKLYCTFDQRVSAAPAVSIIAVHRLQCWAHRWLSELTPRSHSHPAVGILAAQCAFARGASRVIIIDEFEYRLQRAKEVSRA